MPKPIFIEGDRAQGPNGDVIVFSKGRWYPEAQAQAPVAGGGPAGTAPKLSPQEQITLSKQRDTAKQARWVAEQADRFMQLNKQTGTGGMYAAGFTIPFTKGAHVDIGDFVKASGMGAGPELQVMDSITSAAAPRMRPTGSGSTSNYEFRQYRQAFPNIANVGPANSQITHRLHQERDEANAHTEFLDNYARQHGGLAGAEEAYLASRPEDPALAQRIQTAHDAYMRSWMNRRGTLDGAEPGWQRFKQTRFGKLMDGAPDVPAAQAAPAVGGWSYQPAK
jgi:hypothetical protein